MCIDISNKLVRFTVTKCINKAARDNKSKLTCQMRHSKRERERGILLKMPSEPRDVELEKVITILYERMQTGEWQIKSQSNIVDKLDKKSPIM